MDHVPRMIRIRCMCVSVYDHCMCDQDSLSARPRRSTAMRPLSELFTRSTALKLVNAQAMSLKHLVITDPQRFTIYFC